jgi:hypothetical protein
LAFAGAQRVSKMEKHRFRFIKLPGPAASFHGTPTTLVRVTAYLATLPFLSPQLASTSQRPVWLTLLPYSGTVKQRSKISHFRNWKKSRSQCSNHSPSWPILSFTRTKTWCWPFPIYSWVDLHKYSRSAFHFWHYQKLLLSTDPSFSISPIRGPSHPTPCSFAFPHLS